MTTHGLKLILEGRSVAEIKYRISQKIRVRKWRKMALNEELLFQFDLANGSTIFDVGGHKGEWARKIATRYDCTLYIFETVEEFVNYIKDIFQNNLKVQVFPFGLAGHTREAVISKLEFSSSVFREGKEKERIELKDVVAVMKEIPIKDIQLMKINIEGGEYELLERLVETGDINRIDNLLVQFHSFVPNAKSRMQEIKQQLMKTHSPVFQCEFVWEHWRKR